MRVNREDYIVIGVNIGMEHYDEERCEEFDVYRNRSNVGEMTYLIDGMSGNYFIVGEVVSHGDGNEGFGVQEVNIYGQTRYLVAEFIQDKFGIYVSPQAPKVIVVSHLT